MKILCLNRFIFCRTFILTFIYFIGALLVSPWPFICNFTVSTFIGMRAWRFLTYCPGPAYVKRVGSASSIPHSADWDSWTSPDYTPLNLPGNLSATAHPLSPSLWLSFLVTKFVSPTTNYSSAAPPPSSTVWQCLNFILMSFLRLSHRWTLSTSTSDS